MARHAGLVNICGVAIQNYLLPLEDRMLKLARWQSFSPSIMEDVLGYNTFQRMVKSLKEQKDAVDCLRSCFLGNFDEFVSAGFGQEPLAQYLAAVGVLAPHRKSSKFKMISPIVDSLVRRHVIPALYPAAPSTPIPMHNSKLDIQGILKEALRFFDQQTIKRATQYSFKTAKVKVGGVNGVAVPRESVYDSELIRILAIWLHQGYCTVTGQWHHLGGNNHRYSDIVVETKSSRIVLELLATGELDFIEEHVKRTSRYKSSLSAEEAWVIHFTREDNYLEDPYWQSDELLNKNIYLAHIWHNQDFTEVRMRAKWKSWDSENRLTSNERII